MLEYLLQTARARRVAPYLEADDVDVWVPALCDVEIVSGLRRAVIRGDISKKRGDHAIADYLDLPLVRTGHQSLLGRIFALRSNFSSYDAAYVSLAERLGAALLTADVRLARSVRAHTRIPVAPD